MSLVPGMVSSEVKMAAQRLCIWFIMTPSAAALMGSSRLYAMGIWIQIDGWVETENIWFGPKAETHMAGQQIKIQADSTYVPLRWAGGPRGR